MTGRTGSYGLPTFVTDAIGRGKIASAQSVESASFLTAEEAAHMANVTRQTISNRRLAGKLFAVPTPRNGYKYPAWQFEGQDSEVQNRLQLVSMRLKAAGANSWQAYTFAINPDDALGGACPVDHIRDLQPVEIVLALVAEHFEDERY